MMAEIGDWILAVVVIVIFGGFFLGKFLGKH